VPPRPRSHPGTCARSLQGLGHLPLLLPQLAAAQLLGRQAQLPLQQLPGSCTVLLVGQQGKC
jgi:hypothetical protein